MEAALATSDMLQGIQYTFEYQSTAHYEEKKEAVKKNDQWDGGVNVAGEYFNYIFG